MNKTDCKVLYQLARDKNVNDYESCTIYELLAELKYSYSTVNYCLKSLIREGYVSQGIKDGLKDTYYVTKDGIDKLIELGHMKRQALFFHKGVSV